MSYLTTKEKLKKVLDLCEKHDIKAYEIGENTPLNTSGVHRILTGEVENPRGKTLSIILDYLEKKIAAKEKGNSYKSIENHIEDPGSPEVYQLTVQEIIARRVFQTLEPHIRQTQKNYEKISDEFVNNTLDLMQVKNDLQDIKNHLSQIQKTINEMNEVVNPQGKK